MRYPINVYCVLLHLEMCELSNYAERCFLFATLLRTAHTNYFTLIMMLSLVLSATPKSVKMIGGTFFRENQKSNRDSLQFSKIAPLSAHS